MVTAVRAARIILIAAILAAVIASMSAPLAEGTFRFANFFGYFTIQSNLIGAAALMVSVPWTGRARPPWVELLRACATTYLVIVVIVYWTLLYGLELGIEHAWANLILHAISGVALLVDWILEGPRSRLPMRRVGWLLVYPAVWLAVVLVRGATDGWVPYPFLDPDDGYARVAVVSAVILIAGLGLGAAVFRATGWRRVGPAPDGGSA